MADVILGTGAIQIHATDEGLKEQVQEKSEAAGEGARITVPIEMDDEEFQATLDRIKGELEELKGMLVEPKAGFDIEVFQEMMDEVKADLDELSRRVTEPSAALRADEVYEQLAKIQGAFDEMKAQGLDIPVRLDDEEAKAQLAKDMAEAKVATATGAGGGAGGGAPGIPLLAGAGEEGGEESEADEIKRMNAALAEMRMQLAGLNMEKVRIQVGLDGDEDVRARLEALDAEYNVIRARMREAILLKGNADAFFTVIEAMDADLEELKAHAEEGISLKAFTSQAQEAIHSLDVALGELKLEALAIKISPEANTEEAKEKLRVLALQAEILNATKVTIRADLDDSEVYPKYMAMVAMLEGIAAATPIEEKEELDTGDLQAKIAAVQAELAGLQTDAAVLHLTGDDAALQATIDEVKAHLAALTAVRHEVEIALREGTTQEHLDEILLKLELIDHIVAKPRVQLGGAKEAEQEVTGLENAIANLRVATGMFQGGGGSSLGLGGLASLFGPELAGTAGVLGGGFFATFPAFLGGLTSAVAALAGSGLSGVMKTISAGTNFTITPQQQLQNVATQISNQQSLLTSSQGVTIAVEGMQQAYFNLGAQARTSLMSLEQAQDTVRTSTQALAESQFQETQAQYALTIARQNAKFALENYSNQLKDATLTQEGNRAAIQAARLNLLQTEADPATYAFQREQALIQYKQAIQAVKDQTTATQQLKIVAGEARSQGIAHNPAVLQAHNALTQAQQQVVNAAIAQKEALQNLTNTELTNTEQTKLTAEAYQNAKVAVREALGAVAETNAQIKASIAGMNPALETFQNDLALLPPAAQKFVEWWQTNMKPIFHEFKVSDSSLFFTGLEGALTDLQPLFQDLFGGNASTSPFLAAAAGIGNTFKEIGQFLGSPEGRQLVHLLLEGGNSYFKELGDSIVPGLHAFLNVGVAGIPLIKRLGGFVDEVANSFLKWTENGGLTRFMNWMNTNIPPIMGFLHTLFGDIKDVAESFGGLTAAEAGIWTDIFGAIGDFLKHTGPLGAMVLQMLALYKVLSSIAGSKFIAAIFDDPAIALAIANIVVWTSDIKQMTTNWQNIWDGFKLSLDLIWAAIKLAFADAALFLVQHVLNLVGTILHGMKDAFGWLPVIGGHLKSSSADFDAWEKSVIKSLEGAKKAASGAYDKFGALAVPKTLAGVNQVETDIMSQLAELKTGTYPTEGPFPGAATGKQYLINNIEKEIAALKKAAAAMPDGPNKKSTEQLIAAYEKALSELEGGGGTTSGPSARSSSTTPNTPSAPSTRSTGDFIKGSVEGASTSPNAKPTVNVYIGQQKINDLVDTRVEWHDQQLNTQIEAGLR